MEFGWEHFIEYHTAKNTQKELDKLNSQTIQFFPHSSSSHPVFSSHRFRLPSSPFISPTMHLHHNLLKRTNRINRVRSHIRQFHRRGNTIPSEPSILTQRRTENSHHSRIVGWVISYLHISFQFSSSLP